MGIISGSVWVFKKFTTLLNPYGSTKENLYIGIRGFGDGADIQWEDLLGVVGTIQLPGDLMIEIVSRLPVKSIICFKSVCRAWYSLFNHPIFIQHHFRIASSFAKMNNLLSFFVHTSKIGRNGHLLSLLLDRLGSEPIFIDLNPPFESNLNYLEVMGSINGLVCLNLGKNVTIIVLWNPATREHSHIAIPKLSLGRGDHVLSGFAYDHETDIYKVVRVLYSQYSEVATIARVEIYNTGTDTWRTTKIVDFPANIWWSKSVVLVGGGTLYWYSHRQQVIMSFDASSEAFGFHPVTPNDKPHYNNWWSVRLEAMGEHPVLTYFEFSVEYVDGCRCVERIDIRKLKKCDGGGKDDSFYIEMSTVEPPLRDLKNVYRICGNGRIIAEDPNGELLFYDGEETKYLSRVRLWESIVFYDYIESLVWPSGLA